MYGQVAAHRSPLAPRPDLSGLLTRRAAADNFEEPQAPHPTPHVTMVRTSSPPTHTLPHPAPHETRRATRCRHPENSLPSPYRASRLLAVP